MVFCYLRIYTCTYLRVLGCRGLGWVGLDEIWSDGSRMKSTGRVE